MIFVKKKKTSDVEKESHAKIRLSQRHSREARAFQSFTLWYEAALSVPNVHFSHNIDIPIPYIKSMRNYKQYN